MRGLLALCVTFGSLLALSNDAFGAELRTEVSARRVGVGQTFEVSVTAIQGTGEPEPASPRLSVRGEAQVRGPSISSQQRIMMRNFNFDTEQSVVARWQVTPTQVGKLVVGPGTFQVGGKALQGETIVVEVVEEAQAQPRRRGFDPRSLFGQDPFDSFGDDPFADMDDLLKRHRSQFQIPPVPPEYLAPRALDEVAFLHVVLDKQRVVLGEPVRLTVLAYGSRGNFREVSPNEPSLSDFLSYSVIESSHDQPAYGAELDGTRYVVRKLREYVLIPLKTGSLEIGSMTAVLQGNRGAYPSQGSPLGMLVSGPKSQVQVVEPPMKGRPDGYFPGDVGKYELKVDVSPREVTAGEFIQVIVQIQGEGEIPSRVLLPESRDLTWEEPTIKGGPEIRDDILQGTRTLDYAVQVHTPGALDLGEVRLPFYDHERQTYRTARVSLGRVEVSAPKGSTPPGATPPSLDPRPTTGDDGRDSTGIPFVPRARAGSYAPGFGLESTPLWPWVAVWGLPGLVLLGLGGHRVGVLFSRRRSSSSKGVSTDELRAAKKCLESQDERGAVRHLERALYDAIERATGRNVKGVLREQVGSELGEAGEDEELSRACQAVLEALDQVRYDTEAASLPALLDETSALCSRLAGLERKRRRSKSRKAVLS